MKAIFTTMTIGLALVTILLAGRGCREGYVIGNKVTELSLADDASTPAKKSEYLGKFIRRMEHEPLAEYATYLQVWRNERNRTANQFEVVKSLKQRCDDLAKVDPSSLGYAQGMQQITGQEFDHSLAETKAYFESALEVKYGWFYWYGWSVTAVLMVIFWVIAYYTPAYVRRGPRAI